jgi:hypothetical protein
LLQGLSVRRDVLRIVRDRHMLPGRPLLHFGVLHEGKVRREVLQRFQGRIVLCEEGLVPR